MTSDRGLGASDSSRRDALPPSSLLNAYRLGRVLGSGGFGIVYFAHHEDLDRQVAIKEYLPIECAVRDGLEVNARGEEYREAFEQGLTRFRDEARRLVELDEHPAIVSCRDFFRTNGTAYLVMEYAEGRPLSEVLRVREAEGRPFGQLDLLNVIVPLLEGLAKVHAAGIIHRDIKPSNIMIRESDGKPMLLDFGAAKEGLAELSKSMAPFTEGYAAFEQVGEGKLGPWTDIYAVGAVMWRMVAGGKPPWEPPTPARVESRAKAQLSGDDDPLPAASVLGDGRFSARVLRVIEDCLRLREGDRIQGCSELLRILRTEPALVGDIPSPGDSSALSEPVASPSSNVRGGRLAALGIVLLTGVGLLLAMDSYTTATWLVWFTVLLVVAGMALLIAQGMDANDTNSQDAGLRAGAAPRTADPVDVSDTNSQDAGAGRDLIAIRLEARQGSAEAQHRLGTMYASGQGVPQDDGKAVEWYLKAADQGHVKAQTNLGFMVANGRGVWKNDEGAAAWFRKAADQGDPEAQFNLGQMYANGRGVSQDDSTAVAWLRKAADQGKLRAQRRLGEMYVDGRGVPQDDGKAVEWYRKAADQGDPQAQYQLGYIYANSESSLQSYVRAHAWWNVAAAKGYEDAGTQRARIGKKMTPEQISEAQSLSHELMPR